MNRRERLRRCYFHEEADRPAVYSRTGFPRDDPSYDKLKAYLVEHTEQKLPWDSGFFETPYHCETLLEPYTDDFRRVRTTIGTPAGKLEATHLESLKGQPGLHETHFIKTREDVEKYLSLPLPEVCGDVGSFFAADKEVGDSGIVDVHLGMNPGGFAVELCGSENFAILSVSDRDVLYALCERRLDVVLRRLKHMLELDIGPFFSMSGEEYVVPPMHGPQDFRDFNVKHDRPIIDLVHEAGGRMHIHCHGRIRQVIEDFVDMGTDVLHPFEAPPMGDITASEARVVAGNRMCLEGNIQIAAMYESRPDEIRAETERLIRDAWPDGRGLIVSPTASPYIRGRGEDCFDRYRAMVETVLEWKA